ncbi:IS110 family transposase [Dictyobacter arantiisoli]|uniref:IS110 family transposase n=1 Tax=Dictyobacter arantiisoli TaxID=2014874 RepID=A0A5A5TJR2_9CHLR|nr:IS110 family transposase [Dictyobacter arantiisoli]GCF11263.1 IS110 family transposase [Dictyobacter arantiisoli]
MEILYPRCAGLDVHKKSLVACILLPDAQGHQCKQFHSFSTMLSDLQRLRDLLTSLRVTHVAMESTGVFWKPIYNVLEDHFTLLVVNAQHIKAVPGRKTDSKDAEWIADLLQHGLLRPSFVPSRQQRDLRELTRYRTSLVQERARTILRLQKILEDANLKLASVVSDLTGTSAHAILHALLDGTTDPSVLAQLACGRLRSKRDLLEQALAGTLRPHHRFLVTEQLALIDALDDSIEHLCTQIAELMRPFEDLCTLLCTIPGIGRRTAEILLAELGPDMTHFPSARHLASWAGMCPGNRQSAGKRLKSPMRKGNPWLRSALVEAAHAAARSSSTYLSAQYQRLAARRGANKATVALGHTLLVIIYQILSKKEVYHDLGSNYFDEHDRQAVQKRLVRRLETLGYQVQLTIAATDT